MKLKNLNETLQTHRNKYTNIQLTLLPEKPGKCTMLINMNGECVSGNINTTELNVPKDRGTLLDVIEDISTGNYDGEYKTAKINWEKATGVSRNYSYGNFKVDNHKFSISSDTHNDKITVSVTNGPVSGYFILCGDMKKSKAVSTVLTLIALIMRDVADEEAEV